MQENQNSSNMSLPEWLLLTAVALMVDVAQIIFNFIFGSGVVINRIISIGFGISLGAYLTLRGVSLLSIKRLIVFTGAFAVEEIPVLDSIPTWTIDVLWTWWTTKSKLVAKVTNIAGKVGSLTNPTQALNVAGRRSSQPVQPLNSGGIRAPGGGLPLK